MTANIIFFFGMYNCIISSSFGDTFCFSEWISMEFYKKVQYDKRKVGIDFRGYHTNSVGVRGKQGPKTLIL